MMKYTDKFNELITTKLIYFWLKNKLKHTHWGKMAGSRGGSAY